MSTLKHTYARQLPESLFSNQAPVPVEKPTMALFNDKLAKELGIASLFRDQEKTLSLLAGNEIKPDNLPIAQAYAGHQFGHFNRLGDGRAVLLGEMETKKGLYDLQLKGSGRTPYSRRGDGRATYYSMLREYLISEAMKALLIPTTRSLAVVKTGEPVYRELANEGAVLSRVAASHIRVGTFEYARYYGEEGDLKALLEYTIERHYSELAESENPAVALLERVMMKQKNLIIDWLRVGFIHGVMNTDNMAISGETIDYGPCAFMNQYNPETVFSSIDTQGRYAFANQPNMAYWNLSVLANALLPMIDRDEKEAAAKAEEVLKKFPDAFSKAYFEMMSNKLGILNPADEDLNLIKECLRQLMRHEVDYTNFFTELRRGGELINELREKESFAEWYTNWDIARTRNGSITGSEAIMAKTNPVIIPRNHMVEKVLDEAVAGNMEPFHEFLAKLSDPYNDAASLQKVPADYDEDYQTFCGT
ncbi:MAG: YdiU family protein [Bacteroidota bacterium]